MFLDKRIGEKDSNLSAEDKMIARFTAERVKGSGKSSIFNLGDDFNLTHGGAKLSDISAAAAAATAPFKESFFG